MIIPWTVERLLRDLAARGAHPIVIWFGAGGVETWGSKALANNSLSFAQRLRENGVTSGSPVALWAPNSPWWIAAALGVLASGAMLVPIDDLADAEQFEGAINSCGARFILTTARHLEKSGASLRAHRLTACLVDERACEGQILLSKLPENFPIPADDAPAMLSWTSGTSGSPKAFVLTHRNIAATDPSEACDERSTKIADIEVYRQSAETTGRPPLARFEPSPDTA